MPLVFIFTGIVFILTAVKGDPQQLYNAIAADFTGPSSFVYWLLSIFVLGAVGYIPALKSLSRLFIVLVLIVLLLDNKGFFAKLQEFLSSSSKPVPQGVTQ